MSDLLETRAKTEQGADWRGTITVDIDGETQDLTVRQLVDTEFWEVMSMVDTDELDALQEEVPEDVDDPEDLDEDEIEELEGDLDIFETLSFETFKGLQKAAKYGVEPDGEDIQAILVDHGDEIRQRYGSGEQEAAEQFAQDEIIDPLIEDSTDFTSFAIGIKVLGATLDDAGN